MRVEISDERTSSKQFAVMLHVAPSFPDKQSVKENTTHLQLTAASDTDGKWGWVHLSLKEKNAIGDELLKIPGALNVWRWCLIVEGE